MTKMEKLQQLTTGELSPFVDKAKIRRLRRQFEVEAMELYPYDVIGLYVLKRKAYIEGRLKDKVKHYP